MTNSGKKRLHIAQRDGIVYYSVTAWPGLPDIFRAIAAFVIIAFIFLVLCLLNYVCIFAFKDISPYGAINNAIGAMFANIAELSMLFALAVALIILPSILAYRISPKQFWIKDGNLFYRAKLLGAVNINCRIPSQRILEIQITRLGAQNKCIYNLSVKYEKKLTKPLQAILNLWGRKFTQWHLLLANGITELSEAEDIQAQLISEISHTDKT